MQQSTECNNPMRPAVYARLRGLNRSTVSRQIRDGKIPIHNGMVDPAEADLARENNLDAGRRRKTTKNEPFPPLFCLGMAYLAVSLRDRFDALRDLAIEATGITEKQASKAVIGCIGMASLWCEDLLGESLGKKYAKQFDQEVSTWLASLGKADKCG